MAPTRLTRVRRLVLAGLSFFRIWRKSFCRQALHEREARLEAIKAWGTDSMKSLNVAVVLKGEPPVRHRGVLILANHVSWLDILVLCSVQGALFVAQAEVRDKLLLGGMAERLGYIFLNRGSFRDAARAERLVTEALRSGWPVVLFPEGVTTNGTELKEFHSAVTQAAIDASSVVQPVAVRYLDQLGSLNSEVPFLEQHTFGSSVRKILRQQEIVAELTYGAPIGAAGGKRGDISRAAYRFIAASLGVAISPKQKQGSPPTTD